MSEQHDPLCPFEHDPAFMDCPTCGIIRQARAEGRKAERERCAKVSEAHDPGSYIPDEDALRPRLASAGLRTYTVRVAEVEGTRIARTIRAMPEEN